MGVFCKIPLPRFASDLAGGWRAIDTEIKDQDRASDLLQRSSMQISEWLWLKNWDTLQNLHSSIFPKQEGKRAESEKWLWCFAQAVEGFVKIRILSASA